MAVYRMIPEKAFTKTFLVLDTMEQESEDFMKPLVVSMKSLINALYSTGHRVEMDSPQINNSNNHND